MKILAIRGCNLASLAGEFEIDLCGGALRGAGVFAITGPVGAGKSTLLDALCLALFNRTPRCNQPTGVLIGRADQDDRMRLRSNDVRSVLRRGTSSGFAEVDFHGIDGEVYRARWSVRRARQRVDGTMQTQSMELFALATGQAIGGTNTEVLAGIRDRVGLSFEQFCRSALLAQGDFAKFLEAADRERAELLERMTGTELYGELSVAAFARRKDARAELATLAERLAEQRLLPEDERRRLGELGAALERDHQRLTAEVADARHAARWHRDLLRLQQEELAAQRALARSAAGLEEHREAARREATRFDAEFATHREAIRALRERQGRELDRARAWLAERRHSEPLSRHWSRWSSVLGRYRDSAQESARLEVAADETASRQAAAQKDLALAETARDEAARAFERAEAEFHKARGAAADSGSLTDELLRIETELESIRAAQAALAAAATAQGNEERARERAARAEAAAAELAGRIGQWTAELAALIARREEAERAHRDAVARRSLEHHRSELVAGEPCPLCGALEHPYRDRVSEGIESDLDARVRQLQKEERHQQARVDGARRDRSAQVGLAGGARDEAAVFRREAQERTAALPEHLATEAAVAAARALCAGRREQVLQDQKRLEELRVAVEARRGAWLGSRDEVVARQRLVDGIAHEAARLAAAQRHQEEVRRDALAELGEAFGDAPDAAWRAELARDPAGFLAANERLALDYGRNEELRAGLEQSIEGLTRVAEVLGELADEASEPRFDAALRVLRRTGFPAGAELAELLQREVHRREKHRRRQEELADAHKGAQAVFLERQRQREVHAAKDRPEWSAEQCEARSARAAAELQEIQPRRDETLYALRRDDEARAEVARLEPLIEERRKASRTWDELSDLIGSFDGRAFRVYAQSLTLDCLLAHANQHLRDLMPRYRLERVPRSDLDLQVVDLDMGEEVRSVNSLSGGESFLFSLALALGLSSVSAASTRIESLFIDEGFGSLDLTTLDSALATLDALQSTGRQVGIISHVAGIAERVGSRIEVTPTGPGRSRIVHQDAESRPGVTALGSE